MSQGRQAVPGVKLHSDIHERSSATFTADHSERECAVGDADAFWDRGGFRRE